MVQGQQDGPLRQNVPLLNVCLVVPVLQGAYSAPLQSNRNASLSNLALYSSNSKCVL